MEAQPLRTEIQQGVIHYKGRPAHQGEAENFRQSIVLHSITRKICVMFYYTTYTMTKDTMLVSDYGISATVLL